MNRAIDEWREACLRGRVAQGNDGLHLRNYALLVQRQDVPVQVKAAAAEARPHQLVRRHVDIVMLLRILTLLLLSLLLFFFLRPRP